MIGATTLVQDIKRLINEHSKYSDKKISFDEGLEEIELLELKERLEVEVSFLLLETRDSEKAKRTENNVKKNKGKAKKELTKSERLCQKFLNNPYNFFADSKQPIFRFVSLFIKHKGNS